MGKNLSHNIKLFIVIKKQLFHRIVDGAGGLNVLGNFLLTGIGDYNILLRTNPQFIGVINKFPQRNALI